MTVENTTHKVNTNAVYATLVRSNRCHENMNDNSSRIDESFSTYCTKKTKGVMSNTNVNISSSGVENFSTNSTERRRNAVFEGNVNFGSLTNVESFYADSTGKTMKRNPRRRAKKKRSSNTVSLKLIQTNMDGYTSKKESIDEIASAEVPDIITINDTALNGNMKVKIPEYFCYSKNREKKKGGVATVVANYLKPNTTKVTEGREGDEYIITRFDVTLPAINVVNIYGAQEGTTERDDIEKSWLRQ